MARDEPTFQWRGYDPVPLPIPVPAKTGDLVRLCVDSAYVPVLVGILERLLYPSTWQGDGEAAAREISDIQARLALLQPCELQDGIMPIFRVVNCNLQVSYDDGISWQDVPGASGICGEDGEDGAPGIPGEDGEDGEDGQDGSDCNCEPVGAAADTTTVTSRAENYCAAAIRVVDRLFAWVNAQIFAKQSDAALEEFLAQIVGAVTGSLVAQAWDAVSKWSAGVDLAIQADINNIILRDELINEVYCILRREGEWNFTPSNNVRVEIERAIDKLGFSADFKLWVGGIDLIGYPGTLEAVEADLQNQFGIGMRATAPDCVDMDCTGDDSGAWCWTIDATMGLSPWGVTKGQFVKSAGLLGSDKSAFEDSFDMRWDWTIPRTITRVEYDLVIDRVNANRNTSIRYYYDDGTDETVFQQLSAEKTMLFTQPRTDVIGVRISTVFAKRPETGRLTRLRIEGTDNGSPIGASNCELSS